MTSRLWIKAVSRHANRMINLQLLHMGVSPPPPSSLGSGGRILQKILVFCFYTNLTPLLWLCLSSYVSSLRASPYLVQEMYLWIDSKVLLGLGNTNVISVKNSFKLNVLMQMNIYPGGSKPEDSPNPLNAVNISFYHLEVFLLLVVIFSLL